MGLNVFALCKRFDQVDALRDVDLKISSGEFFTLLGPSGCGKTTLLRIIAGLEMPDHGMIMLNNRPVTWMAARERPVNTVFQSYALFPHLSVLENVCFGMISRKIGRGEALEKAKRTLDMVQLNGFEDRRPHQMSGGQRQRVALARALVNEPEVLLLDEPMSALDAKLRMQVQIELRQLQQRLEKTFVMVTHDQHEALTVSDRMAVMNAGRVAQVGSVREVYARPRSHFVADFLGMENFIETTERVDDFRAKTSFGILRVNQKLPLILCRLGIRPEHIRVSSDPAEGLARQIVQTALFTGVDQMVITEVGLKIKADVSRMIRPGDAVYLGFPEESLVVLYE